MNIRHLPIYFVPLVLLLPATALSLTFTPSEGEWLSWPDYCRARYVVSGAGRGSAFEQRVSQSEVAAQHRKMGEEAWYWLHHYCAALAYISRAKAATTDQWRNHYLREADANLYGHLKVISNDNPMFPDVVVSAAQLEVERGEQAKALKLLEQGMSSHPTASSPYAFAAILYRRSNDYAAAIDVLNRGLAAVDQQSAELQYIIGLMYLESNQLDLASEHAAKAYELGYPLPGLAAKLRRAGRPID